MFPERIDAYVRAWLYYAGPFMVCVLVGSMAVDMAENQGWIYTRAWHTAWVSSVLFLSYLAWNDVRRQSMTATDDETAQQREV